MSYCAVKFIIHHVSQEKKVVRKLLQYGVTCVTESIGTQRPQCMLCNNKLNNSSLAPAKLREHFTKVHGTRKYAGTTHDQFKQKKARFDAHANITSYGFVPVDKPILTASYKVVYLIESMENHTPLVNLLLSQCTANGLA